MNVESLLLKSIYCDVSLFPSHVKIAISHACINILRREESITKGGVMYISDGIKHANNCDCHVKRLKLNQDNGNKCIG